MASDRLLIGTLQLCSYPYIYSGGLYRTQRLGWLLMRVEGRELSPYFIIPEDVTDSVQLRVRDHRYPELVYPDGTVKPLVAIPAGPNGEKL